MAPFNLSATLNALRAPLNPSLYYPHYTVPTFDRLPSPLAKALSEKWNKDVDIRAVVLDKDNCFAIPSQNEVYKPYNDKFQELRKAYPGNKLIIVSNSSGTLDDPDHKQAALLEASTGVKVLRHSTKKPGCYPEVFEFLRNAPDTGVTSPDQVAVVGDRLFTDVLMANMMGSWGIWIKDGIVPAGGTVMGRFEHRIFDMLEKSKKRPPMPLGKWLT